MRITNILFLYLYSVENKFRPFIHSFISRSEAWWVCWYMNVYIKQVYTWYVTYTMLYFSSKKPHARHYILKLGVFNDSFSKYKGKAI